MAFIKWVWVGIVYIKRHWKNEKKHNICFHTAMKNENILKEEGSAMEETAFSKKSILIAMVYEMTGKAVFW